MPADRPTNDGLPRGVRRRFAQHFLEPAWVPKVLAAIQPASTDAFLEIGAGRGALTDALAGAVASVLAIEMDRDLAARLRSRSGPRVAVVTGDVLEADLPAMAARLAATAPGAAIRVAGNLPYNISSPVLFRILRAQRASRPFVDATLMLQREVADRLVARPATSNYGPAAVMTQLVAEVSRRLALPPGAFRPAPKVRSAVVQLRFREPAAAVADHDLFEQVVRRLFQRRRKMLLNAVAPLAAERSKTAANVVEAADLDGRRRPETLQLLEWAQLVDALGPVESETVL